MLLTKLAKLATMLDEKGRTKSAAFIDSFIEKNAKEKWMQEAVNPKEKGELHRKLNIPEGQKIPTERLEERKRALQEKAKGDKKLTEAEREELGQVQFALNAHKARK